jgi:hypothetical protein
MACLGSFQLLVVSALHDDPERLGHFVRDLARAAAHSAVKDGTRSWTNLRQVAFAGRFQFGVHHFAVDGFDGLDGLRIVPVQSFMPVDVRGRAVLRSIQILEEGRLFVNSR